MVARAPYAINAEMLQGRSGADFLDTSSTEQFKSGRLNLAGNQSGQLLTVQNDSPSGSGIRVQTSNASGSSVYAVNTSGGAAIRGVSNGITSGDFTGWYPAGGSFGGKNGVIGVANEIHGAGVPGYAKVARSVGGFFYTNVSGTHAGEFMGFVGIFGSDSNTEPDGIGLSSLVNSTDTSLLAVNKGTGPVTKGFSGSTGGNLVFQVANNGDTTIGGTATASSFRLALPKTTRVTISPPSFTATGSGSFVQFANRIYSLSGTNYFYAPLNLPQGAVITSNYQFCQRHRSHRFSPSLCLSFITDRQCEL